MNQWMGEDEDNSVSIYLYADLAFPKASWKKNK
jgi:hypothetical protein